MRYRNKKIMTDGKNICYGKIKINSSRVITIHFPFKILDISISKWKSSPYLNTDIFY